ncbi:hypothetical protein APY94_02955 [Thermococcus celericrescens]|uniref:Uncharacterized protein n=1 Tax=Thermococcus celericrescens TaxID=227598 RepID=A0A124EBJ2_9EURY|nr:hypothetical protein [Thermococcus celericrescens]KUH34249.1 hypothetical protein APY94_02955 [Thermococcus celericrescens]
MSEEAVAQEVVLDEKDITALVEDVDKDLKEVEELLNEEEAEVEEVAGTSGLMSEEEFNARLDEFAEKDHQLTVLANYYVRTLERKAKEAGVDVDFSIWWDIGRPSFNSGLWYLEKVEGQVLQVSGKFGLLVGAGSLLFLTWMYKSAVKKAKAGGGKGQESKELPSRTSAKELSSEGKREERPVKTEMEALRESAKPKEPEKPESELLAKIRKNLGS